MREERQSDEPDLDADANVEPDTDTAVEMDADTAAESGVNTDVESGVDASSADRRGMLAWLGAATGVASIAGCVGGGGSDGSDDDGTTDGRGSGGDGDDGTTDGGGNATDGGPDDTVDPEQRAIELRAILKEFEDVYEQSVLDRADDVRRQHRDSVAFVNLQSQPVPHRLATGWFVSASQLLTVKRKLGSLDSVPVHTVDGEAHEAAIVARHQGVEDLALLELDGSGTPIDRSLVVDRPPEPNEPLVQIGHHDEYGHWVATVGDYVRTQTFDQNPSFIDEHWSNTPGLPGTGGAPVFDLDGNFVGMTNGAVAHEQLGNDQPQPLNDYVYDWQMSHREWFNHLDARQTLDEIDSWL